MADQNKVKRPASSADRRDPIMNIQEVADYLKVSVTSIYRMVQQGRLPGIKIGRQWRFRQADIYNLFVRQYTDKIKKM